jgi:peptide/nickel transport system substrate-binding protein
MTALPDPDRSRAVLIGAITYRHLENLPAVRNNLTGFRDVLIDPRLGGLPADKCTILKNPPSGRAVYRALRTGATAAEDTLLVYFAGHGRTGTRNELYLCLSGTDPDELSFTALAYEQLREAVADSRAIKKVVILDCCFSGRALADQAGNEETIVGQVGIEGTYILTATAANAVALAPPGQRYTAFTGTLLDLLRTGIPGGPELLTFAAIYPRLRFTLTSRQLPQPRQQGSDTIAHLALSRNPAYVRLAEERARREADEQARREAEERARREADEQARREADEQARREADEQARREAEKASTPSVAWPGNAPLQAEPALVGLTAPAHTSGRSHVREKMPGQPRTGRLVRQLALSASAAVAVVAVIVIVAIATRSSPSRNPHTTAAAYNAALTRVVNPSTATSSRTLTFGLASTPDSTDPGNTYYGFMWDFARLYTMPLMTYNSCPGVCGLQVVPDLATGPGVVSNNGLTWTYHIKPNVHFEDGTPVTSQDVKYAVERTFDRGVLPAGPSYFVSLLAGNAAEYPGPFKDRSKNLMGLTAITTPNRTTVVFHLAKPFADFNFVTAIPQTAPVPPNKDAGANYQLHPMSTGPYMFQSYQLNKQLVLVPNPHWNPATDPTAKQLVGKIVVTMGMNANSVDNGLLGGGLNVDLGGLGVQAAARAKILSSLSLKARADDPVINFAWFAYINTKVAPLTNVHCRRAIEYAANKVKLQTAYGGPLAGQLASTVSPPNIIGYKNFDLYEALTKSNGDAARAKAELKLCGQPTGFTTGIAYRSDRPKEVQAAQALRAALSAVGIRATLHGYPADTYYLSYAGVPNYVHQHGLGIDFGTWGPDWPDGYGFLDFIAAGNEIVTVGNANISELNDPVVNNMLGRMASTNDAAARNSYTAQIDMQMMKDAAILPAVYGKSLLYRNPDLTNVYVQPYYGMYDYAVLGLK